MKSLSYRELKEKNKAYYSNKEQLIQALKGGWTDRGFKSSFE